LAFMNLTGDILRGYTGPIILSILEKGNNYGYQINIELAKKSAGLFSLTEATMYTCFKRLEKEALIRSFWVSSEHSHRRKYYSITSAGIEKLNEYRKTWENAKNTLEVFLGDEK